MAQVAAVTISLERVEGLVEECGRVEIHRSMVMDIWTMANTILKGWAITVDHSGSDKVDFTVYYENGESYAGRFDLKTEHVYTADLAAQIRHEIEYVGSGACPLPWVTEEKQAFYRAFGERYEVGR